MSHSNYSKPFSTTFSDRFSDTRTYSKRSSDSKVQAKKSYNIYNNIYNDYAKAVGVTNITDNFKKLVDEFRELLEIPRGKHPDKQTKASWSDWYNRNK